MSGQPAPVTDRTPSVSEPPAPPSVGMSVEGMHDLRNHAMSSAAQREQQTRTGVVDSQGFNFSPEDHKRLYSQAPNPEAPGGAEAGRERTEQKQPERQQVLDSYRDNLIRAGMSQSDA